MRHLEGVQTPCNQRLRVSEPFQRLNMRRRWSFDNAEIVCIVAYFKCGEGLQGSTNAQLWVGLVACVRNSQKQVIVMGDFNITPEVFMTTTMAQRMQVQVLATGEETCNAGNEIDWALVSTPLIADLKVQTNWLVPFKPHAMLQFQLDGHFEE